MAILFSECIASRLILPTTWITVTSWITLTNCLVSGTQGGKKVVPTRQDICKNVIAGTATLKRIVCNPGWQKLCEGTKGLRRKVWTRTKIFSPNIRYVVVILRFVKIYALYKASFRPDSDKRQHYFVQTKDNSFRPYSDKRQLPFVHTQTKDNFLSSRLRQKTASLRPATEIFSY